LFIDPKKPLNNKQIAKLESDLFNRAEEFMIRRKNRARNKSFNDLNQKVRSKESYEDKNDYVEGNIETTM